MNEIKPGDIFGKWTVGEKTGRGSFICRCECGVKRAIGAAELLKGARSRGCRRCRIGFSPEIARRNESYGNYRRNAKVRGLVFDISRTDAEILFLSRCHYCGGLPSPQNGIDRVNNGIGYVLSNCASCCSVCNHMKCDLSVEDFFAHIKKIGDNRRCHN